MITLRVFYFQIIYIYSVNNSRAVYTDLFFRAFIYARGNNIQFLIKTNNLKIKIFSNTLLIISNKIINLYVFVFE